MRRPREDGADIQLNMTPMIDVVFNLLVFFMVVTDLTRKEIEDLTLPRSTEAVPDGPTAERRVIVNVSKRADWEATGNVDLRIRGVSYTLDGLREELFRHAEVQRDYDDNASPSEVSVLIRCDRDVRWREVQWVMQACADPAVRIYRLEFAATGPEDSP